MDGAAQVHERPRVGNSVQVAVQVKVGIRRLIVVPLRSRSDHGVISLTESKDGHSPVDDGGANLSQRPVTGVTRLNGIEQRDDDQPAG